MGDYEETPSFYNSTETFEKYLGRTSYYLALQNAVVSLANFISPDEIVELGTATGETAIKLSNALDNTHILAIDNREKIINQAQKNVTDSNITFKVADMTEYVSGETELPELVVMLYSFHHIEDPIYKKEKFLEQCYESLPDEGYLCIAEGFLEDNEQSPDSIKQLWNQRGNEAYASTFWESLSGIDPSSIKKAKQVGEFSKRHELEAGENVVNRDEEYLVSQKWLTSYAKEVGFNVILNEPCNTIGEAVVLLQK